MSNKKPSERILKRRKRAQLTQLAQLRPKSAYTVIKERFLKLKIVGRVGQTPLKLGRPLFKVGQVGQLGSHFSGYHLKTTIFLQRICLVRCKVKVSLNCNKQRKD